MSLQGDYCDACRTERLPLMLCTVPRGQQFTLCEDCRFFHDAEPVDGAQPGDDLKRRIWEVICKRAGFAP